MVRETLGGYSTIRRFVNGKLEKLRQSEQSFRSLFELMFSEPENILYEKSTGYRIEETTYGACADAIRAMAPRLKEKLGSLPYDSVVAIAMDNSLEWIQVFWSVLMAGYRPLLLNLRLDEDAALQTLRDADAKAVVSDGKVYPIPTLTPADLSSGSGTACEGPFGTEVLVMSSGTSAHVKICAYTAKEFVLLIGDSARIISTCRQIKKHHEGRLKLLAFLPFYHIFGLVAVYTWFAFFSRSFVHLADMSPRTIQNTIRRHKVTHIFAVPLFWNKVYDQALSTIRDRGDATWAKFQKGLGISRKLSGAAWLSKLFSRIAFREVRKNLFGNSIRFMITGGSEIRSEVMEFFNTIGYPLADGYGMTEIGITSVELSPKPRLLNGCSVGQPFSSVSYRVNDRGELEVKSQSSAAYILEGGKRTDRPEWFPTRDLARCENGHYYVLGRQDDVVISPTGENLNPNLIEPKLLLPGVREICLTAARTESGSVPTLLVSVDRYAKRDFLLELEGSLHERISQLKLDGQIQKVLFTSDPLISGAEIKLNRRAIRQKLGQGELPLIEPRKQQEGGPEDALTNRIRQIFAQALGKEEGDFPGSFDFFLDGGGTSLDYFSMVSVLQEEFGVSMPVASGKSLSTIAEIHDFIEDAVKL